jgi:hypothetical protein
VGGEPARRQDELEGQGEKPLALFEVKCLVKLDVASSFNKLPEGCDNEVIPRMERYAISYVPALQSNQR